MSCLFFKKIVPLIIIISLIFGVGANVFVKKAEAQNVSTVGGAVGKALAAGVACFLASKLEAWVAGFLARTEAMPEGYGQVGVYAVAVPTVALNNPAVAKSTETSNALTQSKDCIRDVIAKILLDWLVDETVRWIQGGGKPQFVGNWDKFVKDAANTAVGEAVYQTNAAFLCSPFKLQVQLSLTSPQSFKQRLNCTLDLIVGNIENFYNDFRTGGWIAYNEYWQPQNNYFGVMLMTHDEIANKAAAAASAAANEALAGAGFVSSKRCKGGGYDVATMNDLESGKPGSTKSWVKDSKGNWCPADQLEIVTPASTVGAAVASAVTSDVQWAANIKSWVAALTNAVINRLVKEGLSSMRGSSSSYSGGSYNPYGTYDPTIGTAGGYMKTIILNYQTLLDKTDELISLKNQTIAVLEQTSSTFAQILARNCPQTVFSFEITNLNNDKNRIEKEIINFQQFADEVYNNLIEARGYTDNTVLAIVQKYEDFSSSHQSELEAIYSGAAKYEFEKAQTALSAAQTKLSNCEPILSGSGGGE